MRKMLREGRECTVWRAALPSTASRFITEETQDDLSAHPGHNVGRPILTQSLLQAAARQAKFESSAGGKAAKKAMDNVKKEREADAAARNDTAKEWLS